MKNYKKIYCLFVLFIAASSCTEVIEVDVPEAPPRLVIEASINWLRDTPGNNQVIKLSLSTPYFDNLQLSPVTGASVRVINNEDKSEFTFVDQNDGTYTTDAFIPVMNQSYSLSVMHEGEVYVATETMTPVTPITSVYQSTANGFDDQVLEVNIDFNDPKDVKNFYLASFQRRGDLLPALIDLKDEFTDGNTMSIFYEKFTDEDRGETEFEPGDVVDIYLYGMSEPYYYFIRLLIEQSENAGGPFTTTPAAIKGNCVNITNEEHFPFGYFRLTEADKRVYQFE